MTVSDGFKSYHDTWANPILDYIDVTNLRHAECRLLAN